MRDPETGTKSSRLRGKATSDKPLDRDEKVKLDLPFPTALRALLNTPPPESKPPKGK